MLNTCPHPLSRRRTKFWIGWQDVAPEPGGVPGPAGLLGAGVPQPPLSRQLTA